MFLKWGGVWCMRSTTVGKVSLQDGFKLKGRISLSLCYGTVAYTCVSTRHYNWRRGCRERIHAAIYLCGYIFHHRL